MTTSKSTKSLLLVFSFIFLSLAGHSQFSFSISKGNMLSDASFGYQVNKLVPYVSFKYWSGSYEINSRDGYLDWNTGTVMYDDFTGNASMTAFVPTIGLKYFAIAKNDIKAFVNLSVSKPLISASITDSDQDPTDDDFLEDTSLGVFSGDLGFGVEYFFSENFSIGGEYGFRYMKLDLDISDTYEAVDFNTGQTFQITDTYENSLNFSPTYTKASLNFYF